MLSRYVDAIVIRILDHADMMEMARYAAVPVINGLTDAGHPCQIIADLQAFEEHRGPVTGRTLAWVGDGNNVCSSFIHVAGQLGFRLRIACPDAYRPDRQDVAGRWRAARRSS